MMHQASRRLFRISGRLLVASIRMVVEQMTMRVRMQRPKAQWCTQITSMSTHWYLRQLDVLMVLSGAARNLREVQAVRNLARRNEAQRIHFKGARLD